MNKNTKQILTFTAITYGITWLFHIMLLIGWGPASPTSRKLLAVAMLIPFVSLLISKKLIFKESLKGSFGLTLKANPWFFVAFLLPIVMMLLMNVLGSLLFQIPWQFSDNILNVILINTLMGLTAMAAAAVFEEVAWRGFLHQMFKSWNLWKSYTIIGAIWALWHLPIALWYRYPESPLQGALVYSLQLFTLSFIISYIRDKAGSTLAAALIHGMINGVYLTASLVLLGGVDKIAVEMIRVLVNVLMVGVLLTYHFYKEKRRSAR